MKAIIISCINYKGGCTKTSTTVGLGAALALRKKKVLLVDCDPQSHVSLHLGIRQEDIDISVDNVLYERRLDIRDIILETGVENLCVAPSRKGLLHARETLANRPRRDVLLYRALKPVREDFDFILIDTPPDEGLLTINAIYASRFLIVPTPLDMFSLTGISSLVESLEMMHEAYEERKMELLGILVNRYDGRLRTENESNLNVLRQTFGDLIFETRIRSDEWIRTAQRTGKTVFQRSGGRSKGAFDFTRLAEEVVSRIERRVQA